jgi:hypothetical protein
MPYAAAILRAANTARTQGQKLTVAEAELVVDTAKEVSSETRDAEDLERLSLVVSYAEPYLNVSPA